MPMTPPVQHLACYRHTIQRIHDEWPRFIDRRAQRLQQQERNGAAAEKIAENILEDLFTTVLDWSLGDLNNQVDYADLILTRLGLKYLIIEAKHPGALAWNRHAVEVALAQARRYADEQKVKCIGVSDGVMIYAADIEHGNLHDRMFASLAATEPPEDLWWLSVHGVYRSCNEPGTPLSVCFLRKRRHKPRRNPARLAIRFSTLSTKSQLIVLGMWATRTTPARGNFLFVLRTGVWI